MDTQTWTGGSGWIALALINAGLAEKKSRSRWNWFLLSLLLGPIATFLIVIWSPPQLQPRTRTRADSSPQQS